MSLPGQDLSFGVAVSKMASPTPNHGGNPVLLSSWVHGETSTLFLWREDSGIILPPLPPLGRGSLPEELGVSDVCWTSSSPGSGVVTSGLFRAACPSLWGASAGRREPILTFSYAPDKQTQVQASFSSPAGPAIKLICP